jgi:hypothetical protein
MSARFSPISSSKSSSVKSLVTAGLGLITGGLFLFVLFLSRNPLQQSQDLSSSASVGSGSVEITYEQSPSQFNTTSENVINLKANTSGKQVDGIQLAFDVITNSQQPPEITLNTQRLRVLSQEVSSAGHGYSVKVILATLNASQSFVTTAPESVMLVKFRASQAGDFTLNFDKERSISTEHGSDPPKDLLTHIPEMKFSVTGPQAPAPTVDDFYLVTDDIASRYKTYEVTGSRNEVDKGRLVNDRTYTVKHEAKIQNTLDNAPVPGDPIISVRLQVNDNESVTRTFNRSALTNTTQPLVVQFQTDFKAKNENTFKVTVDSGNSFTEANEGNNTVSNTYGTSSSAKSCNEICSSNSECPNNYRCATIGSEKRCRLNDNVDSSSCNNTNGIGSRTCNQGCADTSECASGFTCWYNQCRNPQNVESPVCAQLSGQAQQAITNSCNKSCSTNRDCANNMRCFNSSCRLASNPSSTSCSAIVVPAAPTKGSVVATPRPTATPKATATPKPSATPTATPIATPIPTVEPTAIPTPTPAPENSAFDSIWNRITSSINMSNILSGGMIPIAVIAAGLLLLIIALVVILKPRSRTTTMVPTQPVSAAPKMDMHAKPNPAPPSIPGHGVIPAQRPMGQQNTIATTIKNPEKIEAPIDTKVANKPSLTPPPSTLKMADTTTGASMVQRLKDKGINMPSQSGTTVPVSTSIPTAVETKTPPVPTASPTALSATPKPPAAPTPTMTINPTKSQWPDEPTQ